ncbi:MAG: hypothetical protein AB1758_06490, partial [Candidatus Eremiobacterota bacterium]
MSTAAVERWEVASDAELVRRGRALTILGILILCLGSVVTVFLMSMPGQPQQQASSGRINLPVPRMSGSSRQP